MQVQLATSEKAVLESIVERYRQSGSPVTREAIKELTDNNRHSLDKATQTLTGLNLIEGVPGTKGGYYPTSTAYEVLDLHDLEEPSPLELTQEYDRTEATIERIEFPDINDTEMCRARIQLKDPLHKCQVDDPILIGPTPVRQLVIAGVIETIDDDASEILLRVTRMEAPTER